MLLRHRKQRGIMIINHTARFNCIIPTSNGFATRQSEIADRLTFFIAFMLCLRSNSSKSLLDRGVSSHKLALVTKSFIACYVSLRKKRVN
jgi:hypothetical protein